MDNHIEDHKEEIIKSLRRELVSSEIRFQNLINKNSIPILIVSQTGIIRYANPAAEFLFHKPKEKLIDIPFGYPLLNGEIADIQITSKNSNFPILAEMRLLETVWEGEDVTLITLRDVTERRNIENQLRVSEEKYRSLVELSPFGIFIHSDGICIFANPAGIRLLGGQNPEDIVGHSVIRFIHPDYRTIVSSRIISLHNNEVQLAPLEEKFVKLDGTFIDVEVSAIKFEYNGKVAIHSVVVDITERKKSEDEIKKINYELETRIKENSKQLSMINSELEAFDFITLLDSNSPISNIGKLANEMRGKIGKKLENSELVYLDKIQKETEKVSSLLKDLMILTNLPNLQLNIHSMNLSSLCNEIFNEMSNTNLFPNLELIIQPNMNIFADSNLIKIVMNCLLDNAIKFTRKEHIAKIEIGYFSENNKFIFFIRDNGIGFNVEHAEKMFDPFKRLQTSENFEGNGVGLALVNKIINKHGGEIWAESIEGKGSTFYFSI